MLKRFVERYQLWSEEKAQESRGKNPLTWLAVMALLLLGLDIYRVVASHQLTLRAVTTDTLLVTFLVLFVLHTRPAWFVVPVFSVICLFESPFLFFSAPPRYPLRVRVLSLLIGLAIGVVGLAYGFFLRRRYEVYLHDRHAATRDI